MTFENNQEIMDMTMKTAYEMEMGPYYLYRQKNMKGNFENVGYAKVDKAGIYNILIMEENSRSSLWGPAVLPSLSLIRANVLNVWKMSKMLQITLTVLMK